MKIRGLGCSMPDRVVTNDEVLRMLVKESEPHLNGRCDQVMTKIRALFRLSGTVERRWRAPGQRAVDFAKKAVSQALERAELKPTDIDLLLYVGVGRGWVEPGMATFFLHECGMTNGTGFDLLDACLSWLRALHVAHNFLKNGVYKNIMVLNAEFNQEYRNYAIKDPSEVAYRFAQLTIGESATATVLSADDTGVEPYFEFLTDSARHDLCKIPLPNIGQYNAAEKCPELDPLVFFAYSTDLFMAALKIIPKMYHDSPELQRRPCDIAFAHSASKSIIDQVATAMDMEEQMVNLYPVIGNTVSASIPTAMAITLDDGRLQRGMKMMLIMGSAGFSAGFCHMAY